MKRFVLPLVLLLGLARSAVGDEVVDIAKRLPAIKPVEPSRAVETFKVQPGFRIELVASEPLIADPVEMMFDERGRMWVLEFRQYNQEYHGGDMSVRGSLKVLEDIDGDGVMDKATTFADGLNYSSAFICWKGGVFLGSTPDIVYLSDTDGDGKADRREVVFTGFAKDANRAGQAQMNSFRWGLDSRIYVCTNSGGIVGRPGDPRRPVNVRGQDFTFDPNDLRFDVRGGGGQHGMTIDRWGNQFNCQSSKPCQFVYYDSRYLKHNPFLPAPSPSVLISSTVKDERLFTISPEEPWRIARNKMRAAGEFRGRADVFDGVVKNHGFFTAASGLTAYCGNAFPSEYQNQTFIGETANHLVYRADLVRDGVGFKSRRVDAQADAEFLASTDIWFRPVQFAGGPDGALYMVDMYREIIEGGAFLPPDVINQLDMSSGDDRGRIYRVLPTDTKTQPMPDLSEYTTEQLVNLLEHSNGWHRDTAARLLHQRQDKMAIASLKKLAAASQSALGRTRARYVLNSLGAYDVELARAALQESDADALIHSMRLVDDSVSGIVMSPSTTDAEVGNRIVELTRHDSARVRYQALFSLSGLTHPQKSSTLAERLREESDDPWMRLAALCGVAGNFQQVFDSLYNDAEFVKTDQSYALLSDLADMAGKSDDFDVIQAIANRLVAKHIGSPKWQSSVFRRLLIACRPNIRDALLKSGDGSIAEEFDAMLETAKEVAFDEQRDVKTRVRSLGLLETADYESVRASVESLLRPDQPDALQQKALEILGRFDAPRIGGFLVDAWPGLSPSVRSQAVEVLFSRRQWTHTALDAVERGEISRGELGSIRVTSLRQNPDARIAKRTAALFHADTSDESLAAVVRDYQPALDADVDVAAGKQVFAKSCSACHRLEDVGNVIGPNLIGIGKIGREAIMLNILDPNRDVKSQYVNYMLLTVDGVSHSGMIDSESANSITLRRFDGSTVEVLRVDVEILKSTGVSFMPVGIQKEIDVAAMADLLSYLESQR